MKLLLHLAIGSLLLAQAEAPRPDIREFLGLGPAPDAAAAKLGEPLYKDNCAGCHGQQARGAQGPNLLRSPLVLHDEKGQEIGVVVKQGRPEAGMPAFPNLEPTQTYQIAEYIHLQVELAANRGTYKQTYAGLETTGDPAKGQQYFIANCATCHSITTDLAKIAGKYPQVTQMQARIAWPTSNQPQQGTVTTQTSEQVTGTLLKSDDFDVTLRDSHGDYRTWPRSEVKLQLDDKLAGHRALLPKYTDADLHNLTAYLETIK